MNWANRITIGRLLLTILFVLALNSSWTYARTAALVIFLVAGISDFVDGEIARRYGNVTNFGKLMDPLVDKIMMAAAFISLVPLKAVPAWAATAVVARDFLITGLRLMASAKGRVLPAERFGKHKTSWQIITVLFFLVLLSAIELHYADIHSEWWRNAWHIAGRALIWITVALTILSGLFFAWKNRELIAPDQ
jgi:CDP-diacylglycerol--glycerol-3-phosphate 3-phosphatidyltransferase